jgi:kynurenine formamidase
MKVSLAFVLVALVVLAASTQARVELSKEERIRLTQEQMIAARQSSEYQAAMRISARRAVATLPNFTFGPGSVIIDVSQLITRTSPGDVNFADHPVHLLQTDTDTIEENYFGKQALTIACGGGTHVDGGKHVYENGTTIDQLDPKLFTSYLVMINVTSKVFAPNGTLINPNYKGQISDITDFEAVHGIIPPKSLVVLVTGWSNRWENEKLYLNTDPSDDNSFYYPGWDVPAATFLVDNRPGIHGIGVDVKSLDYGQTYTYGVHYILLSGERNMIGVENLRMLDSRISPFGAILTVNPLKVKGTPEGLASAFVYVPLENHDRH